MITIKPMNSEDVAKVSKILCECYKWLGKVEKFTTPFVQYLVSQRGSIDTIKRESKIEKYLIARENDKIVGMVSIKENEITKFYIDPQDHRNGIGTQLFNAAEKIITENGHSKMILGTVGKHAIPFYRSMNMVVIDKKKCVNDFNSGKDVIIMSKSLT
jgi:ribosomal protein S18 acetylase RimI-like enzyme